MLRVTEVQKTNFHAARAFAADVLGTLKCRPLHLPKQDGEYAFSMETKDGVWVYDVFGDENDTWKIRSQTGAEKYLEDVMKNGIAMIMH